MNKDLNTLIYRGPEMAASFINVYVSDKSSKIFDFAAGTGNINKTTRFLEDFCNSFKN